MKSNQEHQLNAKVETYQAKKKRLSKEVYDILKAHNYLTFDELKKTDCGYKTTLETPRNKFRCCERVAELDGEAYFEVTNRPFPTTIT